MTLTACPYCFRESFVHQDPSLNGSKYSPASTEDIESDEPVATKECSECSCINLIDAKDCQRCGAGFAFSASQDYSNSIDDHRKSLAKQIGLFGLIISIIASSITVASYLHSRSLAQDELAALSASIADSSASNSTQSDTSWVPQGYTAWPEDSNVAWKWVSSSTCSEDGVTCSHASFISLTGCTSNFYAAVNFLDQSGSVIGYGNATLPSLPAMQTATLEFDDSSNSAKSSEMSQITCQ